jgi:hypothetical protein
MVFQVAENLFCTYFSFEISVRFFSFRNKIRCLGDAWFVFDFVLVVTMVLETWVMTFLVLMFFNDPGQKGLSGKNASLLKIVRLLRLFRMARTIRLLRAVPELMILVRAIIVAFRSVFFTLCLLTIIIYVFAIVLCQLTEGSAVGAKRFEKVPAGMLNLLLLGNLPDHYPFVHEVGDENLLWGLLMAFFMLLAPITVMGMLTGVLVEVVSVVSAVEKETMIVSYVSEQMFSMLKEIDINDDEMLTKDEFQELVVRPDAARMMSSVGVDVLGLAEFCDFLFKDTDRISFGAFLDLVLQLRGTNQATVRDIIDMRKFIRQELTDLLQATLLDLPMMVSEYLDSKAKGLAPPVVDFEKFAELNKQRKLDDRRSEQPAKKGFLGLSQRHGASHKDLGLIEEKSQSAAKSKSQKQGQYGERKQEPKE